MLLLVRWGLALALAITAIPSATPPVSPADLLEFEIGLYPARVLLIARAHVSAVFLDHMRFEVEGGVEDDELVCEALGLAARVMCLVEVPFLRVEKESTRM